MPVTLNYPGVYIQEIPSGVRTIVGVATSITAFVGRAPRGPVGEGTSISSFDDFERRFGGLAADYPLTYAVRDFYRNGGSEAVIVRLYKAPAAGAPAAPAGGGTLPQEVVDAAQKVADAALGMNSLQDLQVMDQNALVTQPRDDYQTAADKCAQSEFALAKARLEQAQAQAQVDLARALLQTALEALNKVIMAGANEAAATTAAKDAKTKLEDAKAALSTKNDDVNTAQTQLNTDQVAMAKKAAIKGAAETVAGVVMDKAAEADVTVDKVKDDLRAQLLDGNSKIKPAALQAKGVSSGSGAPAPNKSKAKLDLDGGKLVLEAASEGDWANSLNASVDSQGITDDVAERYELPKIDLFNLTVTDAATGTNEVFRSLTIDPASSRSVERVLKSQSSLVRVSGTLAGRPVDGATAQVNSENRAAASAALTGEGDYSDAFKALDKVDLFNLLCIPPDTVEGTVPKAILQTAMVYCSNHRAVLIVDPPYDWGENRDTAAAKAKAGLDGLGLSGTEARNAALFFPRVIQADPKHDGQLGTFAACGIIAGVMARTDVTRGVWKAPAGIDAAIAGIEKLQVALNDAENGMLNPLGINCLRAFPVYGRVVWGARTLRGADQLADEYKYVSVRRFALFIEESLYRGLKWVVFEPNDEPLWAQIRLNVGAFMHNLFRQGAFQGVTPQEAYFVKCSRETTTQTDINLGIVNIVVGFAPLKPAEFVIVKIQQMAGQIQA